MEMVREEGLTGEYMTEANTFFAVGLSAALELGDPGFLKTDLEWVKKLLVDRRIPADWLTPYLKAYQQAVSLEMGEAGSLITGWIGSYMADSKAVQQ